MREEQEKFIQDNIDAVCEEYRDRVKRFNKILHLPYDDPDRSCVTCDQEDYMQGFDFAKYVAWTLKDMAKTHHRCKDLFLSCPTLPTFDEAHFATLCSHVSADPSTVQHDKALKAAVTYLVTYLIGSIFRMRQLLRAARHYVHTPQELDAIRDDLDDLDGFLGGIEGLGDNGDCGDYDDADHLHNVTAWFGESTYVAYTRLSVLRSMTLGHQMRDILKKQSTDSNVYEYEL